MAPHKPVLSDTLGLPLDLSETLQSCLAAGIVVVNSERQIAAVNPEAEQILNGKAKSWLGQDISMLPDPLAGLVQETLATHKSVANKVVQLGAGTPQDLLLKVNASVFSMAKGETSGAILSFHNLHPVQTVEAHFRHLDRLASIGSMTAATAHEVKNALTPVKTFIEVLRLQNPDNELGGLVEKELKRTDSIIGQLLKFATPHKPAFSPTRIHTLLQDTLQLVRHSLGESQIELQMDFQAASDHVTGDPNQLLQAFLNILLNAIEAMNHQGQLVIHSTVETQDPNSMAKTWLKLSIEDTGRGIEPENMGRLFETFFTTKPNGTGLGLAITRRIIKEHQGEIEIESQLHQGTRVTIRLPLQPAPAS